MKLKIANCNNFYNLRGVLNGDDTSLLEQEITKAFNKFDKLTVNVENLESIDSTGLEVLTNLYHKAKRNHKDFTIIGVGCKDIYDHFQTSEVA